MPRRLSASAGLLYSERLASQIYRVSFKRRREGPVRIGRPRLGGFGRLGTFAQNRCDRFAAGAHLEARLRNLLGGLERGGCTGESRLSPNCAASSSTARRSVNQTVWKPVSRRSGRDWTAVFFNSTALRYPAASELPLRVTCSGDSMLARRIIRSASPAVEVVPSSSARRSRVDRIRARASDRVRPNVDATSISDGVRFHTSRMRWARRTSRSSRSEPGCAPCRKPRYSASAAEVTPCLTSLRTLAFDPSRPSEFATSPHSTSSPTMKLTATVWRRQGSERGFDRRNVTLTGLPVRGDRRLDPAGREKLDPQETVDVRAAMGAVAPPRHCLIEGVCPCTSTQFVCVMFALSRRHR